MIGFAALLSLLVAGLVQGKVWFGRSWLVRRRSETVGRASHISFIFLVFCSARTFSHAFLSRSTFVNRPHVPYPPFHVLNKMGQNGFYKREHHKEIVWQSMPAVVSSIQPENPSKQDLHTFELQQKKSQLSKLLQLSMNTSFAITGKLYESEPIDVTLPTDLTSCRVVALADGKLPHFFSSPSFVQRIADSGSLPSVLDIHRRLDDIYHCQAHHETRHLQYLIPDASKKLPQKKSKSEENHDDEKEVTSIVRTSLEDAGFRLLTRRDMDLCDALNAGYLLRLSIQPDVKDLDDGLFQEFYPEKFENATEGNDILFDGKVLVFRRGYSQEVTSGKLLLQKLDYLQTSLVHHSVAWLKQRLDAVEERAVLRYRRVKRRAHIMTLVLLRMFVERIPISRVSRLLRRRLPKRLRRNRSRKSPPPQRLNEFFKLSRYGGETKSHTIVGSPNPLDKLLPFEQCLESSQHDRYCASCPMAREQYLDQLNAPACVKAATATCRLRNKYECPSDSLKCSYDIATLKPSQSSSTPRTLLERVTIGNLVDVFSKQGRHALVRTLVSDSKLVEPTYEEVVVIWRPKSENLNKTTPADSMRKARPALFQPPKVLYDLADMFDLEGLPEKHTEVVEDSVTNGEDPVRIKQPLEIRTFEQVPMANLLAVLPQTKLVFRPADAFVFDLISIVSFLIVVGSRRFNSKRLDVLAVASVGLWLLRTVLRYSNKLARYDLLVKTFLTSRISHRNGGAVKYLATEAGSQRATRAAVVYSWLCRLFPGNGTSAVSREFLINEGKIGMLVAQPQQKDIPVDLDSALDDLEGLDLLRFNEGKSLSATLERNPSRIVERLQRRWLSFFETKY